ncbi:MAG: radical SAM family heme chaperone HemW [Candidatus Cryosericum sp.]
MSPTTSPLGVYVHIPFCRRRCNYCDFLSQGGATDVPEEYVDAVLEEWRLWVQSVAQDYALQSIYVGGGTPSLLAPRQLSRMLGAVRSSVQVSPDCEITLEGNPDSLDTARIRAYAEAGVNRLSIGVQSFSDSALARLGRLHSAADAERAVRQAREAGIANLSLDLMYGLPGSAPGEELVSVERAISLLPEHISWYNLTLGAGTPLARSVDAGDQVMPGDDEVLATMREGWQLLESSGYQHYEISNFSVPGRASRHNLSYWLYTDYIGLGLGASGFVAGRRWTNVGDWPAYQAALTRREWPIGVEERLEPRRRQGEYAMLRMRLPRDGLSFSDFEVTFGEDVRAVFSDALGRLVQDGLVCIQADRVTCTQRGLELNNLVAEAFI